MIGDLKSDLFESEPDRKQHHLKVGSQRVHHIGRKRREQAIGSRKVDGIEGGRRHAMTLGSLPTYHSQRGRLLIYNIFVSVLQ